MGGQLSAQAKRWATFTARIEQMTGGNRRAHSRWQDNPSHLTWSFEETSGGKRHWSRIDVRDADGKLALLGNPIYLKRAAACSGQLCD